MAVAIVMDFPGADLAQYDLAAEKMGYVPGKAAPPSCLFHWVTPIDGGLRVVDVWETREAFDAYAQEKIGPITAEGGIPGPPEMTTHEVHNYQIAK